jgi:hypothetical protein
MGVEILTERAGSKYYVSFLRKPGGQNEEKIAASRKWQSFGILR